MSEAQKKLPHHIWVMDTVARLGPEFGEAYAEHCAADLASLAAFKAGDNAAHKAAGARMNAAYKRMHELYGEIAAKPARTAHGALAQAIILQVAINEITDPSREPVREAYFAEIAHRLMQSISEVLAQITGIPWEQWGGKWCRPPHLDEFAKPLPKLDAAQYADDEEDPPPDGGGGGLPSSGAAEVQADPCVDLLRKWKETLAKIEAERAVGDAIEQKFPVVSDGRAKIDRRIPAFRDYPITGPERPYPAKFFEINREIEEYARTRRLPPKSPEQARAESLERLRWYRDRSREYWRVREESGFDAHEERYEALWKERHEIETALTAAQPTTVRGALAKLRIAEELIRTNHTYRDNPDEPFYLHEDILEPDEKITLEVVADLARLIEGGEGA